MTETPSIRLLGVKVHRVDMATTLGLIREFIASGKPHFIVTADASSIVRASEDSEFREIVNEAALVTPDGFGVIKGAAILGQPLIERVSGVDIAMEICRIAAEEGFGVFLLGAEPGVADDAAVKLKESVPGVAIAGTHHGYFSDAEDAEVVAKVRESGAKALLVAMGIPRQEKWIRAHLDELGVRVAIGVGGTLDVFAGRVKRAPVWMQRHGLEWAYRLFKDPSKISKVAALPRFLMMVIKERMKGASPDRVA